MNLEAKTSTNQRKEERKQNAFPTVTRIHCTSHSNCITQATLY